jgi:chromosome segregation ATPase
MAANFEEVIRLVLEAAGEKDVAKLQTALTDLVKTGDLTEDQLAGLSEAMRDFGAAAAVTDGVKQAIDTYAALAAKQGELADAAEAAGLRLKLASEAEAGAAAVLREKQQAVEQLVAAQKEYRDSNDATRDGLKEFAKQVREAKDAQAEAKKEYRDSASSLDAATKGYESAATAQQRLADGIDRAATTIRAAGESTDDLVGAQERLDASAKAAAAGIAELVTKAKATADATRSVRERLDEQDEAFRRQAAASKTSADALAAYQQRAKAAADESANLGEEASKTGGVLDKLKGIAAGVFAFFSVDKAIDGIKSIFAEASEAEQSLAQLDAALASTGRQAEFSADQLQEMATALRDSSNFSDDQIQSAQTRLLSYVNIVGEQFPAALQISIDQAARLGISVESSAEIVGKALQTPSKAMEGLAKQGFVLDAGQRDLLKTLEATGRTAEAQAIILDLLVESYGGAAAAQKLGTAAGLYKALQDQIDDFKQSIADAGVFDFFKSRLAALTEQVRAAAADGSLLEYARKISDGIVATAKAVEGAVVFVVRYSDALIQLAKAYLAIKFAAFLQGMAQSAVRMYEAGRAAAAAATQVGGLRGALASVPANIKIAIALIAIEYVLGKLVELKDAIDELRAVQAQQVESNRALSDAQIQLRKNLDATLAVLGKYRDTAISTREETDKLTDRELKSYQERLEAARRYYSAVEISARRAGDAATSALAAERVREYLAEIARIKAIFDGIAASTKAAEDAQLQFRQALRDLGVDAQNAGDEVTEAGRKILTNFELVANGAKASAQQIGAAYARAIDQVQTTAEVDELAQSLRVAFESGKISAAEYAEGAEVAAARTREIKAAAVEAAGGFGTLKQSSADAAHALIANWTTARDTLVVQSAQIAAAIADALKRGVAQGSEEMKGLLGKSSEVEAGIRALNERIANAQKGLEGTKDPVDALADSIGALGAAGTEAGDGAERAAAGVKRVGDEAKASGGAAQVFASFLGDLTAEFAAVSDAAREYFVDQQIGMTRAVGTLSEYLAATRAAADATRMAIAEQRRSLEENTVGIQRLVDASESGFDAVGRAIGNTALDMQQLERVASQGVAQFSLLNDSDLSRLQAQIDRAKGRLQALQDQALSAQEELGSLGDSLQAALDRRAGDESAVREREFARELERIKELADAGGAGARDAANRARELAKRNFDADIEEINQRRAAEALRAQEEAAAQQERLARIEEESRAREAAAREGEARRAGFENQTATVRSEVTVNVRLQDTVTTQVSGEGLTTQQARELWRVLGPVVIEELRRERSLKGGG